ncbi:uncharacterized protein AB675_1259 [Cyphellophora attinorum]|uniref:Uncharacterized protein n=1 Tax=Cyphellophora attinorum TaxID=1664694 RepID=A0A0N1HI79_9EURO|nr:uncharacterized protein AB675_1259 [Phialophora attinorum]KPI35727.1 hypothetical protein AB675_1259 [Phialophora attinorum]
MALTSQELADIAYAKSATFQDRCDAERELADLLHDMAARRRYQAFDLQQEAFMQRLHSGQLSGLWSKVEDVEDDGRVLEIEQEHTRMIQERIKRIRSELRDLEKFLDDPYIDTDPSRVDSVERTPAFNTEKAGQPQPHKRKHDFQPVKKETSSPSLECAGGTTIQDFQEAPTMRRHVASGSGWACINSQVQDGGSRHVDPNNGIARSKEIGLMQFTDRRDWNEGRLVQRKARKLGRLHYD